jgi:uncharacterized protein (DUF433 family)
VICKTTGVCGGAACISGTRIPVWVLEAYRRSGMSDPELLAQYPILRQSLLDEAWKYVSENQREIEDAIAEDDVASVPVV